MDNSTTVDGGDEIQAMELLDGDYSVWLQWPQPTYWDSPNRQDIQIAVIRYERV